MPFPSHLAGLWQPSSPILVTATSTVSIPSRARVLHAFIVGGGGSGGSAVNSAGSTTSGGGGGAGGSLYARIDLRLWRGELPLRSSRADSVSLTIGNGGNAVTQAASGATPGNPGGTTTLTMPGGLSIAIPGGSGGGASSLGTTTGGAAGASATSYVVTRYAPSDPVLIRPLAAIGMAETTDGHTTNSTGASGGNVTAGLVAETGGAIASAVLLPWWLQAVGISRGSGGAGTVSASVKGGAGGAGAFSGNGGAGAASNTAGATASAGAGYGSGGGGAASLGSSVSGAGAGGCAVLMFEVEV